MSDLRARVFELLSDERERQQQKFGERSIAGRLDPYKKLGILMEEVGEVARALDDVENHDVSLRAARANLFDELVQVGACAVGWLEELAGERRIKDTATGEVRTVTGLDMLRRPSIRSSAEKVDGVPTSVAVKG